MKYFTLSVVSALTAKACNPKGILSPILNWFQNWIINTTGQPLPSWGCHATQFIIVVLLAGLLAGAFVLPVWLSKKTWGCYFLLSLISLVAIGLIVSFVYQVFNP